MARKARAEAGSGCEGSQLQGEVRDWNSKKSLMLGF